MSSSKALQEYADNYISVTRDHYQSLQQELRECREALGFYADKESWNNILSAFVVSPEDLKKISYPGARARAFFQKYPEKKEGN